MGSILVEYQPERSHMDPIRIIVYDFLPKSCISGMLVASERAEGEVTGGMGAKRQFWRPMERHFTKSKLTRLKTPRGRRIIYVYSK